MSFQTTYQNLIVRNSWFMYFVADLNIFLDEKECQIPAWSFNFLYKIFRLQVVVNYWRLQIMLGYVYIYVFIAYLRWETKLCLKKKLILDVTDLKSS